MLNPSLVGFIKRHNDNARESKANSNELEESLILRWWLAKKKDKKCENN